MLKHRCVSIVVRSSAGAVLIHRRSERKDLWPGFWDFCAGGVLASGEDWDEGARRELAVFRGHTAGPPLRQDLQVPIAR